MSKKVGFIGLGQMGKWMAINLVKAGNDVTVFDISPEAVQFVTSKALRPASPRPTLQPTATTFC